MALYTNTTGIYNIAIGHTALQNNTTGKSNQAIGRRALISNTTGQSNIAIGDDAMYACTYGSGNTVLGTYNNTSTYDPVFTVTTENNRVAIGSFSTTHAYVKVDWTLISDARDKTDFAPVPHGLNFVTKLKSTAYRFKKSREDNEGHGPVRYGFKAQDILELEGNTPVIIDADDPNKLRFNGQSLIAVLVNAIQELKSEFDTYKLTHP
jgi:hypothetical protein